MLCSPFLPLSVVDLVLVAVLMSLGEYVLVEERCWCFDVQELSLSWYRLLWFVMSKSLWWLSCEPNAKSWIGAKLLMLLIFRHVCRIAKSELALSCLCVRMEQLGFHWTDLHEIWYLSIFWNSVEKVQFSLKSDMNNGYFTRRPMYVYDNILLISS